MRFVRKILIKMVRVSLRRVVFKYYMMPHFHVESSAFPKSKNNAVKY